MLGFAVLDCHEDAVTVWLVSQTSDTFADNTNAVRFDPAAGDTESRVAGMLADRVVVLTPRTDPSHARVASLDLSPETSDVLAMLVDRECERLQVEFAAEQARRKAAKQARVVRPQWPDVVECREADGAPPALVEANKICALWRCWLKLETIRENRPYLSPGDSADTDLPTCLLRAHQSR